MSDVIDLGIIMNFPRIRYKTLYISGLIILFTGLLQLLTATVFPQDPINTPLTVPGLMHLIIVAISALLAIVLFVLIARWAVREADLPVIRGLSLLTLVLLIGGGVATAVVVAMKLPILGLVERVSIYPFQLWTGTILSNRLLKRSAILNRGMHSGK